MKRKLMLTILNFCMFFIIANLPFLTLTHLFGIDTFIDSFKYPNSYQYIKNNEMNCIDTKGSYILLEKPAHQGYFIREQDTILYYSSEDTIEQSVVRKIISENGVESFYTIISKDDIDKPIYVHQIIGKIKGRFDDTLWNTLCLQIWDLSIDNLNAIALFTS